jgi:hypothetical protein
VGKSTLVGQALAHGIPAHDLESSKLRSPERTSALLQIRAGRFKVVGMADHPLDEVKEVPHCVTVLLLPPHPTYAQRRALRDAIYPHKAFQGDHYPGFARAASQFDVTVTDWVDVFDAFAQAKSAYNKLVAAGRKQHRE